MSEMKELLRIIEGIDLTECESDEGWWSTSKGAKFGNEEMFT